MIRWQWLWQWRVRTLLMLVAVAALILWGVQLQRRSAALLTRAMQESSVRIKLSMLAFQAEQKVIRFREFERTLARRKVISVFTSDDPREREANRAYLAEAQAWWSERAEEYHAQADDHKQREVRFQQAASRPWESLPAAWLNPEGDRLHLIAVEHAELETMCRNHVDGCKGQALRLGHEMKTSPGRTDPSRRQEFARRADDLARSLKDGLIQATWHTAMRRKYRRAAAHPGAPLAPDPPDPNRITTHSTRPWLPSQPLVPRGASGLHP